MLTILRGFEADGPGRLVLDLLRQWQAEDIRVSVVSLREDGPLRLAMEGEVSRLGGQTAAVPMQFHRAARAGARVAKLAQEWDANVLHAHLLRADVTGRAAAEGSGLPLLVTEHGVHAWGERGPLLRPLVRRWYLQSLTRHVTVCAISHKVRRDLLREGVPARRIIEVGNGVDLSTIAVPTTEQRLAARSELGLPRDAFPLVLVLGSLIERKAPMVALEAVARLRRALPAAVLAFAGEGPLARRLRARASALDLSGAVRLMGQVPVAATALAAADILLHPSRDEPFGLAIAEALASGMPVVARVGAGPEELLPPMPFGWLVEGDSAAAWANATLAGAEAIQSRGDEIRAGCRRHAEENFSIASTAEEYLVAYGRALGAAGS